MYNKFLNFYLPQTMGYVFPVYFVCNLFVIFIIGIISFILILCFRKKLNIKKLILWLYLFIIFLFQISSVNYSYLNFNIQKNNLDIWANISFILFFSFIFLLYYIPILGILLGDYIIDQILLSDSNSGGGKK